jgi:hypothetical protein
MTSMHDPDAIIAAWLEAGPRDLADSVRRSIATGVRATPQRRRSAAPWRSFEMSTSFKLAVGAAAVTAAALLSAYFFVRAPSPDVGNQTPAPQATPSGESGSAFQFLRPFDYVIPTGSGLQLAGASGSVYAFEVVGDPGNGRGVNVRLVLRGLLDPCSAQSPTRAFDPGAGELVAYLRSVRGLEVSSTGRTTIGGQPALWVDVSPHPRRGCRDIFIFPGDSFTSLLPPEKFPTTRFIVTEVRDVKVIAVIWGENLDAWLPSATAFVNSFRFAGPRAGSVAPSASP